MTAATAVAWKTATVAPSGSSSSRASCNARESTPSPYTKSTITPTAKA